MKCYCCFKENAQKKINVKGTTFLLCKSCNKLVKKYIKQIKKTRIKF